MFLEDISLFQATLKFEFKYSSCYVMLIGLFLKKLFSDKKKKHNFFFSNFCNRKEITARSYMQKIKIGHRANFREKRDRFLRVLFPVRAISRKIVTFSKLRGLLFHRKCNL